MSDDILNMTAKGDKANREFLCHYDFDGSKWGVSVWASTREEAEMKLRAVGRGEVLGAKAGEVPYEGRCPTCGQDVKPSRE